MTSYCANCGEEKIGHHFQDENNNWFCYETRDDKPSLNKRFKPKCEDKQ